MILLTTQTVKKILFQKSKLADGRHFDKKLSYRRRGTARCVVSVEILPIATQQCSETTCTTSPEQIEVMKLEG